MGVEEPLVTSVRGEREVRGRFEGKVKERDADLRLSADGEGVRLSFETSGGGVWRSSVNSIDAQTLSSWAIATSDGSKDAAGEREVVEMAAGEPREASSESCLELEYSASSTVDILTPASACGGGGGGGAGGGKDSLGTN